MDQSRRLPLILLTVGVIMFALSLSVLALLRPWQQESPALNVPANAAEYLEQPQSDPLEPEPEPLPPMEFTVAAGGDMLIHMPVADSAWLGDTWDFANLMEPVAPYIGGADLSLCNMETPLTGEGEVPSGYPTFAAPSQLAGDMARTGWDGCSTSTNHSLDRGFSGIVNTLNKLDEVGLGHVGTARTEEESTKPQLYLISEGDRTITVAHIAGAYDTNGLPLPEDAPWAWNQIDADRLIGEAVQARDEGADMVIVSLHCCQIEYTTEPEPYQVEVAQTLADSGAVDLVLSHHAHVPKTIELLPGGTDGNGMWVAYGLGNFISNQSTACCVEESSTGLLAFFTVLAEPDGTVRVTDASWMGVTMDFTTGHRVRPLREGGVEGSLMGMDEVSSRYSKLLAIMEGSPATERLEPPVGQAETTVVSR